MSADPRSWPPGTSPGTQAESGGSGPAVPPTMGALSSPRLQRGPSGSEAPATGPSVAHFRPDLEGLRGLAILLVVIFHAAPGLLGGGFIGVDVFFVISGFLITGLLARELDRTGRIALGNFYARRVRRLLPAAILAIGATLLLSAWILPPLEAPRVAGDGIAAALSVSNLRFALAAGDYFSTVGSPSPFLHYWSLSVEEQFYLVWPATLIIAFLVGRSLRAVGVMVAVVGIASLVLAIVLTDSAPNWAFFSLPTRAWQLALGGLLAIAALERRQGTALSTVLALGGWLGLGAVLLGGYAIDESIAYPGLWALIPTLGAVGIIAGGDRVAGPGLLLRLAPVRFLGRISYSLYLWHWPLLVLPAVALGGQLSPLATLALVGLAIIVASASTFLVEEPIRRSPPLVSGRRQVAVVAGLGMSLLLVVTLGVGTINWLTDAAIAASRGEVAAAAEDAPGSLPAGLDGPGDATVKAGKQLRDDARPGRASSAAATPRPTPKASAKVASRSDGQPTAKATPKPRQAPKPRKTPRPAKRQRPQPPASTQRIVRLPADVAPSVWKASEDEELLRKNGCLEGEDATRPRSCTFTAGRGRFVVALVGDSHASHWYPALRQVATERGWQLTTFVKVSCPFTDIPVRNLRLKRVYRECQAFNENVVDELGRLKPDLVITAISRWQHPTRTEDESAWAQGAAMARMLNRVPGRKVVIADVPYPGQDVPTCLSKNLKDIRECAVPAYGRVSGGSPQRERVAAQRSGGTLVDFGDVICGGSGTCPVVSHDRIIFRDDHHLTATFSRWLAPAMDRALAKVIKKKRR